LPTLRIPERQPHTDGFFISTHEVPDRVPARDHPHLAPHDRVGAAVALDAANLGLRQVVESRQIRGRTPREALELLLVEVTGDAEAVVAFLGGERGERQRPDEEEPGRDRRAREQATSDAADSSPEAARANAPTR
jgi:hypothetical protein